jgi:hypothetical protein
MFKWREEKKQEKNASPRWSQPQTQTDAQIKTDILTSAARRKRTRADNKIRRAAMPLMERRGDEEV